ncbi:NAD-dependent epimerase/dehydratase family protein [Nakamurella endophytica]|uniref:NAD-dependent epimerase/dehydratase domain-containing protein n=1 Tax=Nakamurella endophytica TaxID=1748367 RepID=A0A917WFG6_9ACTN|nr:NAD-dependent epimerase/dehydratase family protein [Nakamurella endophytica]GGL99903.1 hypothetical protein GCM10011594_19870 [Nakamurella endophytica]
MRIVVIGGTGHIGSYLVPRLVRGGHEVVSLSRGRRGPYVADPAWDGVEQVAVDRDAEDEAGTFGPRVAALRPDAVVDLLCFTVDSAAALVEALRGATGHLVHCGTVWIHGPSTIAPVQEDTPTVPFGDYGIAKAGIARLLADETSAGGLVTTSVHPGHISGPGWPVVTPLGNLDPSVWQALSAGDELAIPGLGAELLAHVHADDVAQVFERVLDHPAESAGEGFHAVAAHAMTVRGYAQAAAAWFGQEARLRPVSWDEFRADTAEHFADQSWDHLFRSLCPSIDKARRLLGYVPAHTPEDTCRSAVQWLVEHGQVRVATALVP